jgi:hypothetical protein
VDTDCGFTGLYTRAVPSCQSAFKFGSDSLLMQFEGCLAF